MSLESPVPLVDLPDPEEERGGSESGSSDSRSLTNQSQPTSSTASSEDFRHELFQDEMDRKPWKYIGQLNRLLHNEANSSALKDIMDTVHF